MGLQIIDTKPGRRIKLSEIPVKTVFTGLLGGTPGVFYRGAKVVVDLSENNEGNYYPGAGEVVIEQYEPRVAELVLGGVQKEVF